MKWRRTLAAIVILGVLAFPAAARAADEEEILHDARTEGYTGKVQIDKGTTALVWLAFIGLSLVSLGVLFKDAKRTHLD